MFTLALDEQAHQALPEPRLAAGQMKSPAA